MDLDDIEIQTVEVVRAPDGSRICRIYYVKKPWPSRTRPKGPRCSLSTTPHPETQSKPHSKIP